MKKYELTNDKKKYAGKVLRRIKALISFGNIEAGTLGGFIEKEENLSQDGMAWVGGNALVIGNAKICNNAQVFDNALVFHGAALYHNAWVYGRAKVFGDTIMLDDAQAFDDAQIYGGACIFGNAHIFNNAQVFGKVNVSDNVRVFDNAKIFGNSQISGRVRVYGSACVGGDAWIYEDNHFVYLESPALENNCITFFHNKAGNIYVMHGDFLGNINDFEFIAKVTNKEVKKRAIYLEAIALAKAQIKSI